MTCGSLRFRLFELPANLDVILAKDPQDAAKLVGGATRNPPSFALGRPENEPIRNGRVEGSRDFHEHPFGERGGVDRGARDTRHALVLEVDDELSVLAPP